MALVALAGELAVALGAVGAADFFEQPVAANVKSSSEPRKNAR